MKTFLCLALMACLGFITPALAAQDQDQQNEQNTAKPTLVIFHADYCGNCRILEPRLENVLTSIDMFKLNIVKFDYTSRETIAKSLQTGRDAGLESLQREYGAKTGFALLLSPNGDIIDSFGSDSSEPYIKQALLKALGKES